MYYNIDFSWQDRKLNLHDKELHSYFFVSAVGLQTTEYKASQPVDRST